MKFRAVVVAVLALGISTRAIADDKWAVQPVDTGDASLRYVQGVPTVEIAANYGIVRVTPLPLDHGRLSFTLAVYNNGDDPSNFGIGNVAPIVADRAVRVLSKDDLVKMAKRRAFWSQFGIALLGATASGLAASQQSYYSSRFVTPRGTYTSIFTAPSIAGQYQAATITAGTAAGIVLVQTQLDRTILALGDETVQITTVDPGESYAGRIVLDKVSPQQLPQNIALTVNWNGEAYPFVFQIAKPGTPPPAFSKIGRRPDIRIRAETALSTAPAPAPANRSAVTRQRPPEPSPGSFGNSHIRCVTCR